MVILLRIWEIHKLHDVVDDDDKKKCLVTLEININIAMSVISPGCAISIGKLQYITKSLELIPDIGVLGCWFWH